MGGRSSVGNNGGGKSLHIEAEGGFIFFFFLVDSFLTSEFEVSIRHLNGDVQ